MKNLFSALLSAALAFGILATPLPVMAQGYGSHQHEYSRSPLQHCYSGYDRSYGYNQIIQYTGKCFASFDRQGRPLFRYHQYRICKYKTKSKGIFSYSQLKCDGYDYERKRHPQSRSYSSPRGYDNRGHNRDRRGYRGYRGYSW